MKPSSITKSNYFPYILLFIQPIFMATNTIVARGGVESVPPISLPLLTGENDLPLGVQLVGNKLDDLRFLGTANWLEKNCKDEG